MTTIGPVKDKIHAFAVIIIGVLKMMIITTFYIVTFYAAKF